jgi:N-acetylmuramoyl-L-alanine amidase
VRKYLFNLLILIAFLFTYNLNASSTSDRYFYAKKNYTTAVLIGNKQKEEKYLRELVKLGHILKKDVRPYEKKLKRFNLKNLFIQNPTPSKYKEKIEIKPKKKTKRKYSIKNITTLDNQVIVEFNHKVSKKHIKFSEKKVGNIYYDIFDLQGNFKDASPLKLKIKGIHKIWVSQYRYRTLRISLSNDYNIKTIYRIVNNKIIIKAYPKKVKTNKNTKKNKSIKIINTNKSINKNIRYIKNKTIVIDPGHGGKDSGAVGPHKRWEKNVVLKISKYLYSELRKNGFKVYITRNKDKFIELKNRTKYANRKNADMFISIHANSVPKKKAKKVTGIETFFLSPARSARAKRVAALENKADINKISGYSSKNAVLSVLNRANIKAAQKMAIDIQGNILFNLKKYYGSKIVDKGVREGPFWVLVGAQMPAILIEVGYISHPDESKRISTSAYQKRIAHGIYQGIVSYFSKN